MGFLDLFRRKPEPLPVVQSPAWVAEFDLRSQELSPYLITGYEAESGLKAPSTFEEYQALYGEGGDVWVYSCISAIAQDVSNVRITSVDTSSGEEAGTFPHPALVEPYPGVGLADLVELWVTDLLTTANAFGVLDTSGELHQVPPDQIRIYPDRLGHVHHYALVSKAGGSEHAIEPDRVVHFSMPNPRSRFWGTGPSQALRTTLLISDGESQYLINFYRDGARPSGFISFDKDTALETAKQAMRDWNQKHGGKRKHGKTAALPGAKYEQMGVTPVEGGMIEVHRITLQGTLSAYKIPPFRLFILEDADYANAKQQERIYDLKTVIPFAKRRIIDRLNANRLLVPDPNRTRLGLDTAPILNQHRDEKAIAEAGAVAVNAGILTRPEARARGYDLGEMDTDQDVPDTGPITGFAPASTPAADESDGDGETDRMRAARDAVVAIRTNPAVRAANERKTAKRRESQEKRLRRVVSPTLNAMGRDILAIVDSYRAGRPETRADELPPELLSALRSYDFSGIEAEIIEKWLPEILRTIQEEGMIKTELVGLTPETFSVSDPNVIEFVREFGAAEVKHVTEGTKEAIRDSIEAATKEGESVDELAKRLRSSPEVGATRVRAERIAQTETAAAAGYATQRSYAQANEEGLTVLKRWLTVGDGNVRESHSAAEAQGPIPVSSAFVNGMRFPGDPLAPASERINDRCDMIPEVQNAS